MAYSLEVKKMFEEVGRQLGVYASQPVKGARCGDLPPLTHGINDWIEWTAGKEGICAQVPCTTLCGPYHTAFTRTPYFLILHVFEHRQSHVVLLLRRSPPPHPSHFSPSFLTPFTVRNQLWASPLQTMSLSPPSSKVSDSE